MERLFVLLGCVSAFIAVGAGAFGAHALRSSLEPRLLDTFEIAVRYQMYHSLALLAVAWLSQKSGSNLVPIAGYLFLAGILLFSGSLYAYCLSGARVLAMVTPLGGLCFIVAWALLAWAGWNLPQR